MCCGSVAWVHRKSATHSVTASAVTFAGIPAREYEDPRQAPHTAVSLLPQAVRVTSARAMTRRFMAIGRVEDRAGSRDHARRSRRRRPNTSFERADSSSCSCRAAWAYQPMGLRTISVRRRRGAASAVSMKSRNVRICGVATIVCQPPRMESRGVDPRDQTWELSDPIYRVYFHDRNGSSDEYE